MTVQNPLRDDGPLDRALPWTTALLAVVLAVVAVTSDIGPLVKTIAILAAGAIVARAVSLLLRRNGSAR